MEEINLTELLKFYISKIHIIVIAMLVFFAGGFVYINYFLTPMYHSSTTLILVSDNNTESSTVLQSEVTLNKNLVTTYSEIIKSRSVLDKVIKTLDLDMTLSDLSKLIKVTSIENTEIIKLEVSNEDNKMAKDIATTTSKVFMKEVQKIYKLKNISVVDKAYLEKQPYNVSLLKQLILFTGSGFLLGSVIVFLIFYFDTSIKSAKDIEEKLGLSVVGNVTLVEKKNNKKDKRG